MKNDNDSKPWHKEHYVWMIIFFPLLAIIGGVVTTFLAIQSDDGLVVDDYYKEGLEINRTLERDQLAVDYQLRADIKLNKELEEIVVTLGAYPDFIFPENLPVTFLHSTRAGLDKKVNMVRTDEQTYRGNLSELSPGKWYVHIQQDDWRLIKTIYIN